tara:strand:+ start:5405 stop:6718 length:1314 start_codon:yes stop_codon:yes gene_type:complete
VKNKINLINCGKVTISLFPFLLISGPFLTDLFCVILGLIFLLYNFQNRNYQNFFKNYKTYIYFFLIFYLYLNINSLFSFNPKVSFLSSIPFLRIVLFVFALALFFSKFKNLYKIFYFSFFLSICFLFLDSLIQFFFEINIFRNKEIHPNRISSFFGDELIMGSYVSRLLPIILGCSLLINFKKKYLINMLIIFISGTLIILSGERLAAFYYIGTIFIYFILVKKYFLIFISTILISISITFSSNILSSKTSFIDRFYITTINQLKETSSVFSYRHTLHYLTAYEMFLDKKFFGHGLKSFRFKCSDDKYENLVNLKKKNDKNNLIKNNKNTNYVDEFINGCNTHPHNIYLEHMSELGILGVLFLILIFSYSINNFLKNTYKYIFKKKINEINVAKSLVLGGILLQLFPLVPSGSYFNNWMLIIFHLSIGFYLSLVKFK